MQPSRSGVRLLRSAQTLRAPSACLLRRETVRDGALQRKSYATVAAGELKFGQPVHETHPHMLKPGEVTPGISALEYSDRRARLAASLPDDAIAVIASADTKYKSGPVFYEWHQESNFFYLTGFNEPGAVAVIQKDRSGDYIFHLFVRPKDAKAELWDGARSGEQAALDVFNADHTGSIDKLPSLLDPLLSSARTVYTDLTPPRSAFARFFGHDGPTSRFGSMIPPDKVKPLQPVMNELRVVKSLAEVGNMRLAGKYSGRAITNAMRRQFTKEKNLAAFLDYEFRINGCDTWAYVPVVGGGPNALSIHYVRNDDLLHDGDMVLVDAGGEYGGYITDITRTWPINGKFTAAQKDLYEMVLRVQRSSLSLCRASAGMTLDKIHRITENGLRDGLTELGFDVGGNAMDILYPHHTGHYIGLDVHDCPGYRRSVALQNGHCITIEPGVYVPDDERWPKHFRGMGIRIEDSVCIGEDSPIILTTEAVKEVVDIEALRD